MPKNKYYIIDAFHQVIRDLGNRNNDGETRLGKSYLPPVAMITAMIAPVVAPVVAPMVSAYKSSGRLSIMVSLSN
jgi:hypothetical protein